MSSVLDYIGHYQKNIEKCPGDEKRVLRCIDKLDRLPVTVQHLQDTGVGRTVNALRKDHGEVGKASKALVAKWKLMVAEEEESDEEPQHEEVEEEDEDNPNALDDDDDDDDEEEIDQRERNNHSAYPEVPKSESDRKRKYEEKPNDHNKRSKTNSRDSTGQNKYQSDSDASENIQYRSSHNSCDSDSNHSGKYTTNKSSENNDDSDMENKYTNYKHEKTKNRSNSKNDDSHKSKSTHHSSKERSHHKDRNSISESPKDKHNSKSTKDPKSEKKESKDSSGRHKHSEEKHQKHSDEKHQKRSSENKTSSSNKNSSSSSSKSHSDTKKDKDRSNSSDSKSVERNHSSSRSKEKETKSKDDKKSSVSKHDGSKTECKDNKDQSARHKSTVKKESSSRKSSKDHSKKEKLPESVNDDGIGFESGASFAEALGMISQSPTKKKLVTAPREPSNKSSDVKKSDFKSPTDRKEQKPDKHPSSSSKVDTSLLNPDFKLEPLPPLEISALPEISPNYKPRPPPKLLNSNHLEEEALQSVMGSKNLRTKVYSGNKSYGYVPSLYELCVIVLQENIDALEYTGGVPYEILKPIVDKSTPDQLFMLEHYNPYLMDDTDPLWLKHCEKRFRSQKRQEMETWREMYMRCLDEQEAKLKSLTANIKLSQDLKKAPTRITKMAYVDSVVKPPRGIARKQAIYGTAKVPVVSPAARVASLATGNVVKAADSKGAPSSSESSSSRSSSFIKPKKAPLMQKALQLLKGRRKR